MSTKTDLDGPGIPSDDPEYHTEAALLAASDHFDAGNTPVPRVKPVPYSVRKKGLKAEVVADTPRDLVPPAPAPAPVFQQVAAPTPSGPLRIVFTGRMRSGKDYAAHKVAKVVLGFADPIYPLVAAALGVEVADKGLPGVRAMMQAFGQWGRGLVTAKYPWTPTRAAFVHLLLPELLRKYPEGPMKASVDWAAFGQSSDLWLNSLVKRSDGLESVAVTNARFQDELDGLKARGFRHWHVVAPTKEINDRLAKEGIRPSDPVLTDVSEQLALKFDRRVADSMKKTPGKKLRVLWGSSAQAPRELFSLNDLIREVTK